MAYGNDLKYKACQGSCGDEDEEGHSGEIKEVFVSGKGWPKMKFFYCENAIEYDRRLGFDVEIINTDDDE